MEADELEEQTELEELGLVDELVVGLLETEPIDPVTLCPEPLDETRSNQGSAPLYHGPS